MPFDLELTRDLMAEDFPVAERQAQSLGLALQRGTGDHAFDLYIPYTAPDDEVYLIRIRCNGYDGLPPSFQFVNPTNPDETGPQWWARITGMGYPRGDNGEVVYCTPGIREYHQHPSHRNASHSKSTWKLARVVSLTWRYLYGSDAYAGRGGV